DRHRRSERLAAADASDDLRLVVLDLHPPAPPVAVLPPGKIAIDARPIEPHTRRHPGDDDGELRPVRLAGGGEGEFHRGSRFADRASQFKRLATRELPHAGCRSLSRRARRTTPTISRM